MSESGSHPATASTKALNTSSLPVKQEKPRCWGSFEYEKDGTKHIIQFTKEGNDGESGVGGYVFGRRHDCDFVIPGSPLVSGRHFLIYKEMVHDPALKRPVERVFLKDFSSNGTFINGVKVGVNRRVQLKHKDKVNYLHEMRNSKDRSRFIFIEGEPADDLTFDSQYERGPQLGSGNFATVFKATNRKSGVVYAVKIVKKNESFNAKVEASLEREIGILMSIDHKNLLRVCQVFNEPAFYYVVTELAPDGELFDQIIDKQKFTESETRHIFRQVLEGVKYLHDRGVVHRDLKPENILVMDKEAMIVKISDFGLAKMIGERVFFNTVCGTPSYVAPEVIRNGEYGKGVDMWSLGVVLYICLCGFPPFSDDLAPPKLRVQVLQSMYTFPSPYWDEVSDEAVDLVQGLLAQSTDDRLTVDEALNHVWMTMEDDAGTMPSEARTEPMPQVNQLFSRVMTERADRAMQRGVRIGYSQPTPFSQNIPDLPEEDEQQEPVESPELKPHEYLQETDRDYSMQSMDKNYNGSGIGFFSQEGMVRDTGMDTDSEGECENGSEDLSVQEGSRLKKTAGDAESDTGTTDAVAGNDSDRSFVSAQESFNGSHKASQRDYSMIEASMNSVHENEQTVDTNAKADADPNANTNALKPSRRISASENDDQSNKRLKADQHDP
ncbi:hypothetical protein BX616_008264 [Lobosporangium transversale]|uniref:Kinase-like domain-containing protein n=1 Tax=Lobosporangium transversale TaxID=64571 RepID=A0A1Y2GQ45_9FUNG|nr:kinase-like domain-containing protein [Lobosporangium transversale]KAF9914458.1 hypothetical protein BX616_008264 [Lobosporangium transversale]ORZ16817.1 kinase-like domain-containing protein [Lobosporangium transversale]|eukprot:XP_021881752.1 kinase-like domain-containing protein [Lobosporangium transversale]